MQSEFEIIDGFLDKYHGMETHVIIPDDVTEIGGWAFSCCTNLTSIKIPDNVTAIGERAFSGCINLESVIIPGSVKEIGTAAFSGCTNLTSVVLSQGIRIIGYYAFEDCTGLTSIIIPHGVTEVGGNLFKGCINLTSVFMPDSVEDMPWRGEGTFNGCPNVTIICSEGSLTHRYCVDKQVHFIFDYQFEAFHGMLPQGIEILSSPFLADEEKPYIFISYSHNDRDLILPIIKTLYEAGWKIWYDEGLTIGDKYDETLEEHVKNCSAFLLFVTEHSIDSLYVKENEIPWAIDFCKPIIKCLLDEGTDYEIREESVIATVSPIDIESAFETVRGLDKGERREAKGISVAVNPADRDGAGGDGFAYCLYSAESTSAANAILLEARNSGCTLYDAIKDGIDKEKLRNCACLIVFLDKAFLSDEHLLETLIEEYQRGSDLAVCQLEDIEDDDLPQSLLGLHLMQWLNFVHGITMDMNTKLARHLQKRGCRNTSILPGFEYEKADKSIVIKRYTGMDPNPRLESVYGEATVEIIADKAFKNCIHLKTFTIPDGITKIGIEAFKGCAGLESISIPDSVTEIGFTAFMDCSSLTAITMSDSVTSIRRNTFCNCTNLVSMLIPDNVTLIEDTAFENCTNLSSIIIPHGVTDIKHETFKNCRRLNTIILSDKTTMISYEAFENCISLTSIDIPDTVTVIGKEAFKGCINLASITLPNSVTKIEAEAFSGCSSLTSIIIPESVTEFSGAFRDCTSLVSVTIPNSVTSISSAFCGCTSLTSITISDSVKKIDGAFNGCKGLTSITLPDGVESIICAFSGCTSLTSITIPDSVMDISGAFRDCINLASITIPDNVIKIGFEAFKGCINLVSVTIPDSVTMIEYEAFSGCTNLTSIVLSDGVRYIRDDAFSDCPKLCITCPPDSYVWEYCKDNDIPVKASIDTVNNDDKMTGSSLGSDQNKPSRSGFFSRLFGKK